MALYRVQIENDVYSQIGLVMLIGLAAKNSILIVAFAKAEHVQGKPLVDAALDAAKLRMRPLLMTSFAFTLGCVPLDGIGRGRDRTAGDGHGRDRRHGGGNIYRPFPGSGNFLCVEKLSGASVPAAGLTPSPAEGD